MVETEEMVETGPLEALAGSGGRMVDADGVL
jgi:hypothetical protein